MTTALGSLGGLFRLEPDSPLRSPLPRSVEQPLFQTGPGEDQENQPHGRQGRSETGEADPCRGAQAQPPVEAHRLGVHKKQVALPERLDSVGRGVADGQDGDACSQDGQTQGQVHLQGEWEWGEGG